MIERGFYQELGLTPDKVDELPWRTVWEYQVYIELIMRDRAQKRQQ